MTASSQIGRNSVSVWEYTHPDMTDSTHMNTLYSPRLLQPLVSKLVDKNSQHYSCC